MILISRFTTHNIALNSKPSWFLDLNPVGKVPTLKIDNDIFHESLILGDFLEEKYPTPRLTAETPEQRAKDKMLVSEFETKVNKPEEL